MSSLESSPPPIIDDASAPSIAESSENIVVNTDDAEQAVANALTIHQFKSDHRQSPEPVPLQESKSRSHSLINTLATSSSSSASSSKSNEANSLKSSTTSPNPSLPSPNNNTSNTNNNTSNTNNSNNNGSAQFNRSHSRNSSSHTHSSHSSSSSAARTHAADRSSQNSPAPSPSPSFAQQKNGGNVRGSGIMGQSNVAATVIPGASAAISEDSIWARLSQLQSLHSTGVISAEEYEVRKRQLVDELTGTRIGKPRANTNSVAGAPAVMQGAAAAAEASVRVTTARPTRRTELFHASTVRATKGGKTLKKGDGEKKENDPQTSIPIARPPPSDWSSIPLERGLLYSYDIETGSWSKTEKWVRFDASPFARGSLRHAHHLLMYFNGLPADIPPPNPNEKKTTPENLSPHQPYNNSKLSINQNTPPRRERALSPGGGAQGGTHFVAKVSIDPFEERESYFQDVIVQMFAKKYSQMYNKYKPPKLVDFVKAHILELIDRPQRPLCGLEHFVSGPYRKHNNNFGYVNEEERNTPQAFSHFTYEASSHSLLICDIQGVGDLYTDPQIHSIDGVGFGKGNMGDRGIEKFLVSHRCNPVCRYLKLPMINVKSKEEIEAAGTIPSSRYMAVTKIEVINLQYPSNDQPNDSKQGDGRPSLEGQNPRSPANNGMLRGKSPARTDDIRAPLLPPLLKKAPVNNNNNNNNNNNIGNNYHANNHLSDALNPNNSSSDGEGCCDGCQCVIL